jgi:hypothetical protein
MAETPTPLNIGDVEADGVFCHGALAPHWCDHHSPRPRRRQHEKLWALQSLSGPKQPRSAGRLLR